MSTVNPRLDPPHFFDPCQFPEQSHGYVDDLWCYAESHTSSMFAQTDPLCHPEWHASIAANYSLAQYAPDANMEQMGIKLSPAYLWSSPCSQPQSLYSPGTTTERSIQSDDAVSCGAKTSIWSVDIRYIDMHRIPGEENIYCISILVNFRATLFCYHPSAGH